jgi:DNA repair photolyase
MMAKRFGKVKNYAEWIQPKVVENTMELLEKELPRFKNKIKLLHLCFTTDPFMYQHDEIAQLSLKVLQRANAEGVRCSVLTKGLLPYALTELPLDNEYGITVVSLNDDFVNQYEPGAAPITDRIASLQALADVGKKTWVSIEPYPTPNMIEQDLHEILEAVSFADKIIFGRLHYNKIVSAYPEHKQFYNECAKEVIEFCEGRGISYHIKKGTIT